VLDVQKLLHSQGHTGDSAKVTAPQNRSIFAHGQHVGLFFIEYKQLLSHEAALHPLCGV
jgi:hypothetical protein